MSKSTAATLTATTNTTGALTLENRQAARDLIKEGTPASTLRAREGARRYFGAWADASGLAVDLPIHPDVVLRFVTEHLRGLPAAVDAHLVVTGAKAKRGPHSVATVEARVSHLAVMHRTAGHSNPCADPRVVEVLKAARRIRGRNGGQAKKAAATLERLSSMLGTCDDSPAGVRDRALLLVAFASGGRRRSEVAVARVEDLREVEGEYILTIRHSKTDQEGEGFEVPVTGRAAVALTEWLQVAGITSGAIFRRVTRGGAVVGDGITGQTVAHIVQKRADRAGFDAADFGAHSLRAGFITEGAGRGIPLPELMQLSGHKTTAVAMGYYRGGAALHSKAGRLVG